MYDTIVVPTDGSDHAVRAAEHADAFAGLFDATVHLVNAVDVQAAAGPFDAGGVDDAFVARLEAAGEAAIHDVEDAVTTDSVRTAVVRGRPAEAIVEYAEEHGADLLAMGTHGRRGIERYLAGSVTERAVRLAEIPVLTVRATTRSRSTEYDEILVPTDGSERATAAVDHAIPIAGRADARVHAVNVVDAGALGVTTAAGSTRVIERLTDDGRRATEAVADRVRAAGLGAVTAVREDYPARGILEYAEENDVDLIVMGTAGRTGIDRYLVGSTTATTVRRAEIPVVVVREGERNGAGA